MHKIRLLCSYAGRGQNGGEVVRVFKVGARLARITLNLVFIFGLAVLVFGQSQSADQKAQTPQEIPDAPSAARPSFPPTSTPVGDTPPPASAPQEQLPPNQAPPGDQSAPVPPENPPSEPPPPMKITTVPEGEATPVPQAPGSEQLYRLRRNVNQVIVPFMVKDDAGHLVEGVLPKDVSVYENGKK
jgi:hypothetical protein